MVDIAAIGSAIGGMKSAYEMAKAVQTLKTDTEIRQATSAMLDGILTARHQLIEASETQTALLSKVRDLESEILSLKAWEGERERYQLKRYYPGTFAFALKPEMANGEPPHRLCAHCYQQRKKALLQANNEYNTGTIGHKCPLCKTEVWLSNEEIPAEQI